MQFRDSARLVWDSKTLSTCSGEEDIFYQRLEKVYPYTASSDDSLFDICAVEHETGRKGEMNGRLLWGDNRLAMRFLLENGFQQGIDLIYIDPPYLSSSSYNSTVRITDTAGTVSESLKRPVFVDDGPDSIDDYLDDMYPRLLSMKELLSPNGSIFIHLDWHVSHYVKILLDEIFSSDNFINEIIWCYGGGSGSKRHFHRKHDMILWYAGGKDYTFNPQYRPYTSGTLERGLTRVKGYKYRLHEEGALMQDWWTDINKILSPTAGENLKFPTQKPKALIKRLIATASNQDALVADFYGGSGTTASVCQEMGRRWISCDDSEIAVQTSFGRLIKQGGTPFSIEKVWSGSQAKRSIGRLKLKPAAIQKINENSALLVIAIEEYQPLVQNLLLLEKDWGSRNLIDFWEVDLAYDGEVFNSDVQIVREKKKFDDLIPLELKLRVPMQKKYRIAIKLYDVFGDTSVEVLELAGLD